MKNFGAPSRAAFDILYVWPCSYILKGNEAPNIKNFEGVRGALEGGGLGGGFFSGEILLVYALLRGLSKLRVAPVRFCSVTVWGWNGSSGSGFRFRRFL